MDSLKEKWYAFSDWLDEKGIPKPLFFLLVLLVLVAVLYFSAEMLGIDLISGIIPPEMTTLTVTVKNTDGELVEGADVKVEIEGFDDQEKITNSEGEAEFDAPIGRKAKIYTAKGDIKPDKPTTKEIRGDDTVTVKLNIPPEINLVDKEIRFLDESGQIYTEGQIRFNAFCTQGTGAGFSVDERTQDGSYKILNLPDDCILNVQVKSVSGMPNFSADEFSGNASEITDPIELTLIEEIVTGTATVILKTTEDDPIESNCKVSLIPLEGGESQTDKTVKAGETTVTWLDVLAGTYKASSHCSGQYEDDSTTGQDIGTSGSSGATNFYLNVEDTGVDPAEIKVFFYEGEDETPVKDIKLKLYTSRTAVTDDTSTFTDADGTAKFTVGEKVTYYLMAWKGSTPLFDSRMEVRPREEKWKIEYVDPDRQTSALIVNVVDGDGNPIELAEVMLKISSESEPFDEPKKTGVDGRVEWEELPENRYVVTVSYSKFDPMTGEEFLITEGGDPIEKTYELIMGKGNYQFAVRDPNGLALQGASINGVDLTDSITVVKAETDKDGMAALQVRVDKNPFFIVEAPGYMPFVTEILSPLNGHTHVIEIEMIEEASKIEAKLLGLMYDDGSWTDRFVENGHTYTAIVQLVVPNKNYSSAGLHLRTGEERDGQSTIVEEDVISLGAVKSNAQRVFRSSTYSPPNGSSADRAKLATGPAKWADIEWMLGKNGLPKYGVFNAVVEVNIDDAFEGDAAKLAFRGWGDKGSFDRDPVDSMLGTSSSAAGKQGLYANTYDMIYSVGNADVCLEGYCRIITIEDLSTKIKKNVIPDYDAIISNSYKLRFAFNKNSPGAIRNAKFKISNPENGLEFKEFEINDTLGGKREGIALDEISEDIGTLDQYGSFSGWVEFDTVKEGANQLILSIESESGDPVDYVLNIIIEASGEMSIAYAPREIIPLIDNQLVFNTYETAEDGTVNAVSGATVEVFLDGTLLGSGLTDGDGIYGLELEAPSSGSTVKVAATKPGYARKEREIEIDDTIVTAIPNEADLEFIPLAEEEETITFSIENFTAIPLTLSSVSVSTNLSEYVELVNESDLEGTEIESTAIQPLEFNFRLTQKGIAVKKTTTVEDVISLEFSNEEVSGKWILDLDVDLRILLGGEVDLKDCLFIDPTTWEFTTYGDTKRINAEIRNNCTSNGNSVALRELSARVYWLNENEVGNFTLLSDSFDSSIDAGLTEEYVEVVDMVPAEFEGTISISFNPDTGIKSAEAKPEIQFRARHYADTKAEEIRTKISTDFSINKLAECLRIVRDEEDNGDISLKSRPYNSGWGQVEGYFDRDPYAEDSGTTTTDPSQGLWPTSGYQYPWQTGYGYPPYGQDQDRLQDEDVEEGYFTIENACTDNVEVNLKVPTGLEVEETTFEIEPYGSYDITVLPTARIGRFTIKVRGKLESEQGFFKEIDKVKVRVSREDEIEEQCKPIVEPMTFRATFLGWQRSAGRIRVCPLIEQVWGGTPIVQENGDQRIEVLEFGLKYNPHVIEQFRVPLEGTLEERVGQIRIVTSRFASSIVSPGHISIPITTPKGESKFIPREVIFEDPFQWIGVPGMILSSGDPNRMPADCIENKNYFVLGSWEERWSILGDTQFTENKFKWKENVPKREMLLPYAISNDEVVNDKYCGSEDKIQSVIPTVHESDNGVKVIFALTENGHHVLMTVDRSKMETQCEEIYTEVTLRVKRAFHNTEASDVILPVSFKVLNNGIREWTPGCDTKPVTQRPIPDWAVSAGCPGGFTGPAAFQNLGFNKLKFDWREGEITSTTCDPVMPNGNANQDYFFCDATQFTLSLSQKFDEVWNLTNEISKNLGTDKFREVAGTIGRDDDMMEEINGTTGKLYKLYKQQIAIHDYETDSMIIYFMKDKDSLLKPPELADKEDCDPNALMAEIEEISTSLTTENETQSSSKLQRLLNEFDDQLGECYGEEIDTSNVIGLIPVDTEDSMAAASADTLEIWHALTMAEERVFDYEDNDSLDAYVITFNEYLALHNNLLIQWRDDTDGMLEVRIGNLELSASTESWIEFLDILETTGIDFKVGVRNTAGMSEELENYVKEEAGNSIDEDFTKLASTELSTAMLINDNYSDNFVRDFANTYKDLGFGESSFRFKQFDAYDEEKGFYKDLSSRLENTGEYWYRVEPFISFEAEDNAYSITLNQLVVNMALKKNIGYVAGDEGAAWDYNPFFYLPFDGEVGQGKGDADYGVGFSEDLSEKDIFFYFDADNRWMKPVMRRPGFIGLIPEYSEKYSDTRDGSILKIDRRNKTFTYNPSSPVALGVNWNNGVNNTIYYGFAQKDVSSYGNQSNLKELFVWWNGDETEPRTDSFEQFAPDSQCDGWNENETLAKIMLGANSPWNSIVFVPATDRDLELELVCARQPTVISAEPLDGTMQSSSETTGISGGTVHLNNLRGGKPSLKDYLDRVWDGEICINARLARDDPDLLELTWNPRIVGLSDHFITEFEEAE